MTHQQRTRQQRTHQQGTHQQRTHQQRTRQQGRTLLLVVVLASVGPFVGVGCSKQAKEIGTSALIKFVNVKCLAERQKFSFAVEVADKLGVDEKAKEIARDAAARTQGLRDQIAKVKAPTQFRDQLDGLLAKAKEIPGHVADRTITPEEGRAQLEQVRNELRAKGLGNCVG
jgi:hypothetical protein